MKKLALVLICILMLITLVACGDKTCQHRDADDNSLCDKCGESYTDGKDLPDAHTHDYTVKNTDSEYLATAADCQNPAKYYYSCSCGIKGTQIFSSGSVLAHSPKPAVEENRTEATCIAGHYDNVVYCSVCREVLSRERITIPADVPHNVWRDDSCMRCGLQNSTPGLKFSLNSDGKTFTVTGIGTCEEKNIVIGLYNNMTVTGIGDGAFRYCTSLTSITIPDSVQEIDDDAFDYCLNLETVTFGANSQLSSIGSYAFWLCTSLTSITIPDSVTSIGDFAFSYCTSLRSINVDSGNKNYKSIDGNLYTKDGKTLIQYAIGKKETSFTIPDSVTSIGSEAFSGCTSLTSITIPSSVLKVDDDAFYGCSNLQTVNFGENSQLSSIGSYAFENCTSLVYNEYDNAYYLGNETNPYLVLVKSINTDITSINIHEKTKIICGCAFYDCTSLTSVTIPDSVTSIGDGAFAGCAGLTSTYVGVGNKNYTSIDGNLYTKDGKTLIQYAMGKKNTSFTIPDGVTSIGFGAFYDCTSLTSIHIPSSVQKVDDYAFYDCSQLQTVTFGANSQLSSIGFEAFRGCTSLTSITIPSSVLKVDDHAFSSCSNLQTVTFGENSQLSSIGTSAFSNCTSLTSITIPDSVTSIGFEAFSRCTSLTSITIPSSVLKVDDHAFYNCSNLQTVTFGANSQLSSIGSSAFYNCTSLTSITIPSSVQKVDREAFYKCSNLKTVTFGENSQLSSIGTSAFEDCTSLTSIKYRGTQAQWDAISKGSFWNYNTGNYTITYNYTGE